MINKTAVNFKNSLINWLCAHDAPNLEIDFEDDFSYAIGDNDDIRCINIGVNPWGNEAKYFAQFIYEFGCEYVGIPTAVLAFLHELGHHFTLNRFNQNELLIFDFKKESVNEDDSFKSYTNYWLIPDEFAANMWMIDFINNNIEDVEELCNIYIRGWNKVLISANLDELVEEEYCYVN